MWAKNPNGRFRKGETIVPDAEDRGASDGNTEKSKGNGGPGATSIPTQAAMHYAAAANEYGVGYSLMRKMGWTDGVGLGKDGKGIAAPLAVKGQSHKKGLRGAADAAAAAANKAAEKPRGEGGRSAEKAREARRRARRQVEERLGLPRGALAVATAELLQQGDRAVLAWWQETGRHMYERFGAAAAGEAESGGGASLEWEAMVQRANNGATYSNPGNNSSAKRSERRRLKKRKLENALGLQHGALSFLTNDEDLSKGLEHVRRLAQEMGLLPSNPQQASNGGGGGEAAAASAAAVASGAGSVRSGGRYGAAAGAGPLPQQRRGAAMNGSGAGAGSSGVRGGEEGTGGLGPRELTAGSEKRARLVPQKELWAQMSLAPQGDARAPPQSQVWQQVPMMHTPGPPPPAAMLGAWAYPKPGRTGSYAAAQAADGFPPVAWVGEHGYHLVPQPGPPPLPRFSAAYLPQQHR